MNALMKRYKESNFQLIAIPCNQFGFQEPGANHTEILHGLKYVRPGHGFQPSFPITKKVDVNGEKEIMLYTFLKVRARFIRMPLFQQSIFLIYSFYTQR